MVGSWNDDNSSWVKNDRGRIDRGRKVGDVILNIWCGRKGKLWEKWYEDLENERGMELKDICKEGGCEKIWLLKISCEGREVIGSGVLGGCNKDGRG